MRSAVLSYGLNPNDPNVTIDVAYLLIRQQAVDKKEQIETEKRQLDRMLKSGLLKKVDHGKSD